MIFIDNVLVYDDEYIDVIENTEDARNEYESNYCALMNFEEDECDSVRLILTKEDINNLVNGKQLAVTEEECIIYIATSE